MNGTEKFEVIEAHIDRLIENNMSFKQYVNCSKALVSELLPNAYRDKICFVAGNISKNKIDLEHAKNIIGIVMSRESQSELNINYLNNIIDALFQNNLELRKEVFVEIKRSILGE
ncbi:hypothetical protein [Burkholderia cepacia]|uniref:hypothetical protein n=1 Tax=Burkholderia cepacia TaxID=292 RepID=UPI00158B59C7|nr:hypothetical protein [Burkholderia cepacia]